MLKRRNVKVGDVFQILCSEGVCYGLVTHKHVKWDWVIAIFREFYDKTPKNFDEVVAKEPQFVTIFLINHAVRRGYFSLVAEVKVPEHLQQFPVFRITNNLNNPDAVWYFWNGDEQWEVDRPLTEQEKKYPKGPSFPSAPLIIKMIEDNYRAERDYI